MPLNGRNPQFYVLDEIHSFQSEESMTDLSDRSPLYQEFEGKSYIRKDVYDSTVDRAELAEKALEKRLGEVYEEAYRDAVKHMADFYENVTGGHPIPENPYNGKRIDVVKILDDALGVATQGDDNPVKFSRPPDGEDPFPPPVTFDAASQLEEMLEEIRTREEGWKSRAPDPKKGTSGYANGGAVFVPEPSCHPALRHGATVARLEEEARKNMAWRPTT